MPPLPLEVPGDVKVVECGTAFASGDALRSNVAAAVLSFRIFETHAFIVAFASASPTLAEEVADVGRRLTLGLAFFLSLPGLEIIVMVVAEFPYTPFAALDALVDAFLADPDPSDDFCRSFEDLLGGKNKNPIGRG